MILQYLPTDKIIIDGVLLEFYEDRDSIRPKIAASYKEDNQIIQFGDSDVESILQRRDIYQNINSSENFFFLGYDENDLLHEVEIHQWDKIKVFDVLFGFADELAFVAFDFSRYSPVSKKSEGEYFFKELKIVIMDQERMGGEGDSLGYFYCASDVKHLEGI